MDRFKSHGNPRASNTFFLVKTLTQEQPPPHGCVSLSPPSCPDNSREISTCSGAGAGRQVEQGHYQRIVEQSGSKIIPGTVTVPGGCQATNETNNWGGDAEALRFAWTYGRMSRLRASLKPTTYIVTAHRHTIETDTYPRLPRLSGRVSF